MPKPQIEISLLSNAETHRWSFGAEFMSALIGTDSRLTPDRAGYTETSLKPFTTLEDFKSLWVPDGLSDEYSGPPSSAYSFEWKRRSPLRSSAMVRHGSRDIRGNVLPGSVHLSADWRREINFSDLFNRWIHMAKPSLAMLHLFTAPEQIFDPELTTGDWDDFRRHWTLFQLGSFGYPLKPTIPNIGWAMVYGGQYAEAIDADSIRAAGFPIEPLGEGWLVRVTEQLSDVAENFGYFSARRDELRSFFPNDMFLVTREPVGPAEALH